MRQILALGSMLLVVAVSGCHRAPASKPAATATAKASRGKDHRLSLATIEQNREAAALTAMRDHKPLPKAAAVRSPMENEFLAKLGKTPGVIVPGSETEKAR